MTLPGISVTAVLTLLLCGELDTTAGEELGLDIKTLDVLASSVLKVVGIEAASELVVGNCVAGDAVTQIVSSVTKISVVVNKTLFGTVSVLKVVGVEIEAIPEFVVDKCVVRGAVAQTVSSVTKTSVVVNKTLSVINVIGLEVDATSELVVDDCVARDAVT